MTSGYFKNENKNPNIYNLPMTKYEIYVKEREFKICPYKMNKAESDRMDEKHAVWHNPVPLATTGKREGMRATRLSLLPRLLSSM